MKELMLTGEKFSRKRAYLPMLIFPLIMCMILSVIVFYVTRDQLMKSGQTSVEKFHTQASGILDELSIVNDSLLNNELFLSLINQDTISDTDTQTIIRTISNTLIKNSYVKDAMVISRRHGAVYTGSAHYVYSSLVSLLQEDIVFINNSEEFTEDDLQEGWMIPYNNYSSPCLISYIYDDEGAKTATLVVILNKAYLHRSLFVSNSDFCCMYNSGFLISSYIKSDPTINYTSQADISRLVGAPVEVFSVNDEHYSYLVALKRNIFYRPLYIIISAFGMYILVVLLYSLLHIRKVNRQEKAFFASLIAELPQPVTENADLASIFASIQKALENYKEEHVAFSEQSKYSNLDRLVQGFIRPDFDEGFAASMDIDPKAVCYYMARFHFSEEGIMNPANRSDLISIIIEQSMNGFAKSSFRAVCFPQEPRDVCAILNVYDESASAESVHEVIGAVYDLLEQDYGIIFTCSLSGRVDTIYDIAAANQETIDLFRFVHAIDSNTKFVSSEQMQAYPSILIQDAFLKQLRILSGTLILGKYDMVPAMVDAILEDHVAALRKNYALAEKRINCIACLLYETPLPSNLTEEQARHFHDDLLKADSIASLSQTVHSRFDTLRDIATRDSIVDKACTYISEQISNSMLSVPEIAEYSGASVHLLSKRFKESTGMTMVEYINHYRCEKVQELLKQTGLNISDIAEKTGYTNTVTLTRNFKRYVGCTPSEYRSNLRVGT